MAGTVKANVVQLGDSATASQNLTIKTNVDGTFTIARGNNGSTTQDILTIDSNGRIATPQSVVAFRSYLSAGQSIANSSLTKLQFNTKDFDTASCFNNTGSTVGSNPSYSFLPTVAGYYQFGGTFDANTVTGAGAVELYKNGSRLASTTVVSSAGNAVHISSLTYMNGTTDYVDLRGFQNSGGTVSCNSGVGSTQFWGYLVEKA